MSDAAGSRARAQADVISVVLLLAVVVAGTGIIVAFGGSAIGELTDAATTGAATQSMTQFDAEASLVAHGDSGARQVTLAGATGASRRVESDAGWMNITVRNVSDGTVREQLVNVTLGAVVYEEGNTTVAYQGGGVWRQTDTGSSMVSPPEFHYRQTTLTLPLVTVSGEGEGEDRLDGEVLIRSSGPATAVYPNESANLSNPLESGEVVITVKSRYYEAWARFFEQRTGGAASVNHTRGTATVKLRTPSQIQPVSNAVAATSAGDDLDMQGSGSFPAFTDSYNSSAGNYSETKSSNGTIRTAGAVKLSGNAVVKGNVRSGGVIELSGQSEVTGTAWWTTGFSATGSATYGEEEQIDGVESADPVEGLTREKIDTLRAANDNNDTAAVSNDRLDFGGGSSVTLSDDEYYLTGVDMDGKELVVDTGGDEVAIAVDGDLSLDGSKIEVTGGGIVRFYVAGDVTVESGSNVTVPADRSTGLWVYGTEGTETTIKGSQGDPVRFVGVVYTPDQQTDVSVQHADVYGGLVAGEVDVDAGGSIHFDRNLRDRTPVPADADVPRITYLHVSVTGIEVSED